MENQPLRSTPVLRMESLAALERGSRRTRGVRPVFRGAGQLRAAFVYRAHQIDVFVAYYRNQRQGPSW
jgi:hypothetical protein